MMDNFSVLSLLGMTGLLSLLAWRLYKALHTNSTLEHSISEQQTSLESHQSQLQELQAEHEYETTTLSEALVELRSVNQDQAVSLEQITKDHEALQKRHRALEQDLLAQMKQVSDSEITVQNHQREQANLTQKLEQHQVSLQKTTQENKSLQTTKSKLGEGLKVGPKADGGFGTRNATAQYA